MSALVVKKLYVRHLGPFDLSIGKGECLVLSGASGTGKSLVLRAIADLIPHEGDISLNQKFCSRTKPEDWRHDIGFLAAESQWWFDSVGEHFKQFDKKLFAQLGFDESVLQWEVTRCSTGERQRLALIRLLQQQPKALLLDEPTASIDAENTRQIEKMIKEYQQQYEIPVLWVSHQQEQIKRIADRHVLLMNNHLTEQKL